MSNPFSTPELTQSFVEFPKIARLSRPCVITEKIDGTNAQVEILEDGTVRAGSRNRYITPEQDNYGFARWVREHEEELRVGLGIGRHYGEWWGSGVQRGYGLLNGEKRFSLFNTGRWARIGTEITGKQHHAPECCHVVPVLSIYTLDTEHIKEVLERLRTEGSVASPGFMNPEGVIVYLTAADFYFKKTIEKDDEYKGKGK